MTVSAGKISLLLACSTLAVTGQLFEVAAETSGTEDNPPLAELSDAEADALVREKFEAKEQREAERLQYLTSRVDFEVLDRKVMDLGERKKLVLEALLLLRGAVSVNLKTIYDATINSDKDKCE